MVQMHLLFLDQALKATETTFGPSQWNDLIPKCIDEIFHDSPFAKSVAETHLMPCWTAPLLLFRQNLKWMIYYLYSLVGLLICCVHSFFLKSGTVE